ncbi:hypothetical protein LZ31DRAFT_560770, partial [Colletotrichum somersetense]
MPITDDIAQLTKRSRTHLLAVACCCCWWHTLAQHTIRLPENPSYGTAAAGTIVVPARGV